MKEKKLVNEIGNMYGNVLAIGYFDEKIIKAINSNKKITTCNILGDIDNSKSKLTGKKQKKFFITKIRKFKKKNINYLIVNYDKIDDFLNTFIKDSIYITNDYVYFYTKNKEKIIRRYKHYKTEIKEYKIKDEYLLIIKTKNKKNNKIKEFYWLLLDKIIDISDYISELLIKG